MSQKNYALQNSGGYIDNFILEKRLEMYKIFSNEFPEHGYESILDVGVTAEKNAISANFFEENFPDKKKIIALSNQDGSFLEAIYPGLKFQSGNAKQLPFKDNSIDVVFSSAVIEHVGSLDEQAKMIKECFRVCKKGVFITTPNRWFPIDPHTFIPFIHWLPKKWHRSILKKIGLQFFALEENLNLLETKAIQKICESLYIKNVIIKKLITFGFISNLIIIIRK
ncbi:MAG: hypothetical protein A3E81_01815 [Gammaproteobacteria bacterium RIFCSPHIGHO2_12_FULL_36_30]|nr:MAG: hypothetical protein A3E81_01815 [Gammaproteobacteria bacterium RIFCSPHIGHO2_12_FULL_36_30]